jgi:murein DD-endopeptidase MepM/ murein hydrolase activator NlpD
LQARAKEGHKAGALPRARKGGRPTALVVIALTTAILCGAAGAASAQDASEPSSGGGSAAASSGGGVAGSSGGSGASGASESSVDGGSASNGSGSSGLTLKTESASPGKVFFNGTRKATYRYSIGGSRARNLKIQAVRRRSGRVVRTWRRDHVQPHTKHTIRWSGATRHGREARKGKYVFRIRKPGGGALERSQTKRGARSFRLLPHKFPVRGRHGYWDGFGAGRHHMGQDVGARCGSKVVAARGGRVQWRGYQAGGAGYYLVIDGKANGHDYVYMHLRRRHRPKDGRRVRTGQGIGRVGRTGNASDCHLHFELWSRPGWYDGGHAMRSVSKHLKQWDRWS